MLAQGDLIKADGRSIGVVERNITIHLRASVRWLYFRCDCKLIRGRVSLAFVSRDPVAMRLKETLGLTTCLANMRNGSCRSQILGGAISSSLPLRNLALKIEEYAHRDGSSITCIEILTWLSGPKPTSLLTPDRIIRHRREMIALICLLPWVY
jgi:hypothetical protein